MEMEQITFGDIKDAVVAKFCVADCAPFYQKALLGCCTASMIQDTGTKHICPILFLDEKGTVRGQSGQSFCELYLISLEE